MTDDDAATERRNEALVRERFDAWRDGTGSPFDLLAEDAVWTIAGRSDAAGTYAGREDFFTKVIRPFNARMSVPLEPVVRAIHPHADTVVAVFDGHGVARDGQPYDNSYVWIFTLRDGKVVKATAFFDSIAFNELWRRVKPE